MPTIAELEAALRIEENALEGAYVARNPTAAALFRGSVRRASEALTAARVKEELAADLVMNARCDCGVCPC